MRLDITLYVLAIVFFMIALLSVVLLEGTKQSLWVITTGLLGTLSLGLGFVQRPKTAKMVNPSQTAPAEVPAPPSATAAPQPTETLPPPPPAPEMTSAPTVTAQPTESSAQPAPETTPSITITPQQIENIQPQAPQEEQLPAVPAPALETPAVPEKVAAVEMKVAEPVNAAVPQEVAEATVESPLMQVSGIGEKRAAQLNALGINTVDDLANASTKDIAKGLKVSPKIVAKWIAGAKQLNKK